MRRLLGILLIMLLLGGCGRVEVPEQPTETVPEPVTWQAQYDLGVRYLSEGKYQEAILAFTAAIEIDPMESASYIGLAEAYVNIGEAEMAKAVLTDAMDKLGEAEELKQALTRYLSEEEPEPSANLSGRWEHRNYPNAYMLLLVKELDGRYTILLEAIRGNYAQIATAAIEHVEFVDGAASFSYEDSFGNQGTGSITVGGTTLQLDLGTDVNAGGNWGVESAEGAYIKIEGDTTAEVPWEGSCVFWQDGQGMITRQEYLPKLTLNSDGSFYFDVNLLEGMSWISGVYQTEYNSASEPIGILCLIQDRGFWGFLGEELTHFYLYRNEDGTYSYSGMSQIGATDLGSVFYLEGSGVELPPLPPPEPVVYDAYSETIDWSSYSIPRVELENVSTEKANEAIYQELYPILEQLHESVELNGGVVGGPYGMSYLWNRTDALVSILVKVGNWNGGYAQYYSYQISRETGTLLSLSELLQQFGLTEEQYYERLKALLTEKISRYDGVSDETFQLGLAGMLSPWNLNLVRPYVNEEGRLCVAAQVETFAGGGLYYYLYDLQSGAEQLYPYE